MKDIRLKVCCISSAEEARTALKCGAHSLGLVSSMPSGAGIISDEKIAEILSGLPSDTDTWLLTSKKSGQEICDQLSLYQPKTIQIVDSITAEDYKMIRAKYPDIHIVSVVHVLDQTSIAEAKHLEPFVDSILLDSGNPHAATKELGGTGRSHNWSISQEIVKAVDCRVYLAGGLKSTNVRSAIDKVKPFGVDVCSGVRTNGVLDQEKLESFIIAMGYCKEF